jgi:transposase
MAREFVGCDRGQLLLMPPSLVEWLPEDHLVWTVLGAVEQMDLDRFTEAYRLGAAGRPAYDPQMMGWIQLVVATLDVEELRCPEEVLL